MPSTGLSEALGLVGPTLISFIGAGGKTTLLYRLGTELAAAGHPVLLTTTTHMYAPGPGEADEMLLMPGPAAKTEPVDPKGPDPAGVVAGKLGPGRRLFLGAGREGRKIAGIDPGVVNRLAEALPGAYLLVEADGAAGRSCKGYAAHEPVAPSATGLLVAIAGLDALGRPLTGEWVHRPEMAAAISGLKVGDTVAPAALALALAEGLRRGRSQAPGSRTVAWLNRATADRLAGGRRTARFLLRLGLPERVVIGTAAGKQVAWEVWPANRCGPLGVAAVVLAAGASSRMGIHKLLLPLGDKSVLARVVETTLALPLEPVVVVLGHRAGEVAGALGKLPVEKICNPGYAQGQSTSLRAGLEALPPETRAVLVFLGDQPLVTPEDAGRLITAYVTTGRPIVYPTYRGRRGNPVLFDRSVFSDLARLEGDQGGRGLLVARHDRALAVPVAGPGVLVDIDTPDDYAAAGRLL